MVEINGLLLNPRCMPEKEEFNNNENDDHPIEDLTATTNEQTTTTVRKKRQPNFVKLSSLGLLVVANTHSYHGPATLNWEGVGMESVKSSKCSHFFISNVVMLNGKL